MQELITVTEAADIIRRHLPSSPTEIISLAEAQGRYLKSPIVADRPLPPFDRVMMDGIAIRHSVWSIGKRDFPIAATQAAGAAPIPHTDVNSCIEVMTGGVLPDGCDCVIPIEEIKIVKKTATIRADYTPKKNQHIHRAGSDTPQGKVLLPAGTCLHAPELTIAASCGATTLSVAALPRIAVISTGDELVDPDQTPQPYQIRRSHATALRAAITANHLGIVTEKHIADDPALLKSALQQALAENDIIVLTGGVSRGKYDYVAPVLKDLLGEPQFHGIAQRPGKPFAFWGITGLPRADDGSDAGGAECQRARADDDSDAGGEKCQRARADDGSDAGGEECKRAIFALPGNPVSVMACAARYLFPSLTQILSGKQPTIHTLPATGEFNCPPHFTGLIACRQQNGILHLLPPSNSGNFLSLAGTHGIAELPGNLTRTHLKNHPATFYPW